MPGLYYILYQILTIYSWIIIIWVILGWLQAANVLPYSRPLHTIMAILYKLTDPVLSFVRRFLPPFGGMDLSPLVVIIAIWILKALLADLLL